jgi:Cytochrome P460
MIKRLMFPALAAVFTAAPALQTGPGPGPGLPRYTAAGALERPAETERWILVGASLGLGYSDATEDGPGMFHRVYLEPTAYDYYLRTGHFRNGTMLALAIRQPARRVAPSRAGWTEGELAALELAVKDTARFAGGWAYFDFGRAAPAARALPADRCARCHAQHAARDNVFVQFYPQLRSR